MEFFVFFRNTMKLLGRGIDDGQVSLVLDSPDDIWHIYSILHVGDVIESSTFR